MSNINLINGDCLEELKKFEDNSVKSCFDRSTLQHRERYLG